MYYFVRKHQVKFSILLTALFSFYITGCHIYKRSVVDTERALSAVKKPIRFYVLDDKFPEDFAWRIDSAVLNKSGVKGHLVALSKQEAQEISRRSSNSEAKRSLQDVMLYVKNSYAQTLFDSTKVELSFDQVTRVEIYEYAKGKSAMATTFVVIGAAFTVFGVISIVLALGGLI